MKNCLRPWSVPLKIPESYQIDPQSDRISRVQHYRNTRCLSKKLFFFQFCWKGQCYWGNLKIRENSTKRKQFMIVNMLNYWKTKNVFAECMILKWLWCATLSIAKLKKEKPMVNVHETFGAPLIHHLKTFNWRFIKSFRLSKTC